MAQPERYVSNERRAPDRRSEPDRRISPESIAASIFRRISWQALVVGTLIALAAQVALFVLGMALGIFTPPETGSLTTRIGIWEIIMMMGGLLPAGYIGSRMAAIPSRKDCAFHGALIWTLTVLLAPSLGGRIGVASAFAIPADLPSALWAFAALAVGLISAVTSAALAAPTLRVYPRHDSPALHIHSDHK